MLMGSVVRSDRPGPGVSLPDLGCGIVVIDFEALTPRGRPMEPIEVAALALRQVDGCWREQARFSALIRRPNKRPKAATAAAE